MGEIQGEKNIMEFTFYVITVIVWSEAWMETKAHTQTHKSKATATQNSRKQHIYKVSEMIIHNVKLKMMLK